MPGGGGVVETVKSGLMPTGVLGVCKPVGGEGVREAAKRGKIKP